VTRALAALAAYARLGRRIGRTAHVVRALALVALLAGCEGGSGQSGSAFVFLSVDGFSVSGTAIVSSISSSTSQTSTTTACVTLRNNRKNPTVTGVSPLDDVIVQSYTLSVNGRTFTFGTAVLVPAGTIAAMTNVVSGNTATFSVIVVPAGAKGGAGSLATAEFTFRGRDGRGSSVETDGAVTVQFVGGAEPEVSCAGTTPTPPPTTPPPTPPTTP
jgi:hypothetical protein